MNINNVYIGIILYVGWGFINEAPKKTQAYLLKLLTRNLKYTSHLLVLSTSLDHREGDGGGSTALMRNSTRGMLSAPAQHVYMSQLNKYECVLSFA